MTIGARALACLPLALRPAAAAAEPGTTLGAWGAAAFGAAPAALGSGASWAAGCSCWLVDVEGPAPVSALDGGLGAGASAGLSAAEGAAVAAACCGAVVVTGAAWET
jgi:hypothetical protein